MLLKITFKKKILQPEEMYACLHGFHIRVLVCIIDKNK